MPSFSPCPGADAFHMADDLRKKRHSITLSALLCIAHALPLACKSEKIIRSIVLDHHWDLGCAYSFHGRWPLDGWNDDVIQPARDAVLNYYKVRARIFVLALNPFNQILSILRTSAMQSHPKSKNTCFTIIYPNFFFVHFSRFSIGGRPYYTSSKVTSSSVLNSRCSLRWR